METATAPWWIWPVALFAVTFAIGVVAVLAGVGGGVLFVPIVAGFFPFHIDFVRGAGLLLALCGALSAAPALLRGGMASLRLAMPLALIGSVTSALGALLGLALPEGVLYSALGLIILGMAALMLGARPGRIPETAMPWRARHTPAGFAAFAGIGLLAGVFGIGAGWANVPALHLLLGAPLKLAVGTSSLLLTVIDTSAAWVYLNRGAVLPMLAVPSIVGVMLGAKLGVRLLRVAPATTIRRVVILLLIASGVRALLKGLGIWS